MPRSTISQPTQQPNGSKARALEARLLADPEVWQLAILTSALTASELASFQEAFLSFGATLGVQVHFLKGLTCIEGPSAPLTPDLRGAVMGWLCSRPEVHFIRVQRRGSAPRPASIALQRVQPLESEEAPCQLLWNEEDLSQDPDDNRAFEEPRHGR